ncbi:MAG TPA: hypothetical protein VNO30_19715 [Kofleriaceae bacterium]|nr:hypothetical protein [Kofleriaceae bacterium]
MTNTLYSERDDVYLVELAWPTESPAEQWQKLLEVLAALDREAHALGALAGTLQVELGQGSPLAEWPAGTSTELREALRARASEVDAQPVELQLHAQPLVVLPDERLEVTDFDSPELWSPGPLPLAAVDDPAPAGLRTWRIAGTPPQHSTGYPLVVRITGELSPWARRLSLDVRSRYDLWLPTRFDGTPNPIGAANAELLANWFRRIAEATGAK